jgi:acyl carrier protein
MHELEATIFPKFQAIVAKSLHIDADMVTPESRLDELGAESLDMIEISMECESTFNVWLPETSILETAEQVLGPGTVVKDGYLTEAGRRMLAKRIRPEELNLLAGEATVAEVHQLFMKAGSWVSMLANLLEHTPTNCAVCQGVLRPVAGFRLQCESCGKEVKLRSGEEINRGWLLSYYQSEHPAATLHQTA